MRPNPETPLRELAIHSRGAIPILEGEGLDYYCDGRRSLAEACVSARLDLEGLIGRLTSAAQSPAQPDPDWRAGSLIAFLAHVEERFHRAHAQALASILVGFGAATRECSDAGVTALEPILRALETTGEAHRETAAALFASMMALEAGSSPSQMLLPALPRVIHDIRAEHLRTRSLLSAARRITGDYRVPAPRLPVVGELYRQLAAWELDAHGHAHLENNVLLPWSAELDPATNRDVPGFKVDPEAEILFPQETP